MSKQDIIHEAFSRHGEVVTRSIIHILPAVRVGGRILLAAAKKRRRLLTCGNGGSAADSQHFASEWLCRYRNDRPPMPAIALTTDTSALTAISNDYDFSHIFARKIYALGTKGDVLVAFTTSGKSRNILAALQQAKKNNMSTIVLTGEGGRLLSNIADVTIVVPSKETARIQEVHQIVYHAWCEFVDANYVAKEKFQISFS